MDPFWYLFFRIISGILVNGRWDLQTSQIHCDCPYLISVGFLTNQIKVWENKRELLRERTVVQSPIFPAELPEADPAGFVSLGARPWHKQEPSSVWLCS